MQNRYVGDIGDFGKFQLFRFLFSKEETTLAQLWFLHHEEENNNDGKYIDYFQRIKGSDSKLESLLKLLAHKYHHVVAIKHKPYSPRLFLFVCHDTTILQNITKRLQKFEKQQAAFWKVYL